MCCFWSEQRALGSRNEPEFLHGRGAVRVVWVLTDAKSSLEHTAASPQRVQARHAAATSAVISMMNRVGART